MMKPRVMQLAKELNLNVNVSMDCVPPSAYGDMFWFRPAALKKAISHGFTYDDFDIEYQKDGTILHAIERCYGYMAQDAGYYYADVIGSDDARTDLSNYSYMLDKVARILLSRGIYFSNFYSMTQNLDAVLAARGAGFMCPPLNTKLNHLLSLMTPSTLGVKEAFGIAVNKRIPFLFRKTAAKYPEAVRNVGLKEAIAIWRIKRAAR